MIAAVDAKQLAEWTLAIARIPSVTGNEGELCGAMQGWLAALGNSINVERLGNALICRGPVRPDVPTFGLFGHLDTVIPATDQPLEIRDGRVFGCGASDMKGGLAVMMGLMADTSALTSANLVAVFYDKEEGPATENGLEPLMLSGRVPPMDFAFCLEPTDNRLQVGCVGGLHADVIFRGQRAHSARPWHGDNAVYKAADFLTHLRGLERRAIPFGDLTYYEVMTATTAHTENSRNVVPDKFTLNINYRFAPGKSIAEAKSELLTVVGDSAEVVFTDEAPSGAVYLDHPLIAPWQSALGLIAEPKQAWTDVARLTARNIPAVNFGPGETALAHQARESIAISDLERNYAAFFALFSGQWRGNLAQ